MTDYEKAIVAHQKQLYAYARYLTRDKYLAEELLQETLLRLLTKADKYEEREKFGNWAALVMHNYYRNTCRSNALSRTRPLIVDYDDAVDELSLAASDSESPYNSTEIMSIIRSLPSASLSRPLTLRAIGYKYEEIAAELHLPLGTVKTRLSAAKELLRERLGV
ncbi:MAG: sigma-70 family RNA polymerase sigma factor [Bacteroidaceae bacterium]|nr:sigma-70 family RNA polymerase sigma factor [Bacteroidaceae bacterium]MBQ8542309.1 sigma-70 family RNA polymerase sigma factor [Bacteroidaceae bacterium]